MSYYTRFNAFCGEEFEHVVAPVALNEYFAAACRSAGAEFLFHFRSKGGDCFVVNCKA